MIGKRQVSRIHIHPPLLQSSILFATINPSKMLKSEDFATGFHDSGTRLFVPQGFQGLHTP